MNVTRTAHSMWQAEAGPATLRTVVHSAVDEMEKFSLYNDARSGVNPFTTQPRVVAPLGYFLAVFKAPLLLLTVAFLALTSSVHGAVCMHTSRVLRPAQLDTESVS